MSVVNAIQENKDRPAYVRFKRVPVENKALSLKEGRFVATDVDYALITPPYSKDCVEMKVEAWFRNLEQDVDAGRIPREWVDTYQKMYAAFKSGQEPPPNGFPIRGWGVISPAQQEMLCRLNILTVEDLAGANDEGMKRIGMGALELRSKAKTWLAQMGDKGPLTQKMAALETQNEQLMNQLSILQKKFDELNEKASRDENVTRGTSDESTSISADDILPEAKTLRLKK